MSDDYISPSDEKDAAMKGAAAESLLAMTRTVAANAALLEAMKARERGEPGDDIVGTATAAIEATRESRRAIAFEIKCIDEATT